MSVTIYYHYSKKEKLWAASTSIDFPEDKTGYGMSEDAAFYDLMESVTNNAKKE